MAHCMVGPNKVYVRKVRDEDTYEVGLVGSKPFIRVAGHLYRQKGYDETAKMASAIGLAEGLVKEVA